MNVLVGIFIFVPKIIVFFHLGSDSGNPDPEKCWVSSDEHKIYSADELGKNLIDYGEIFRSWFTFGALLFLLTAILQLAALKCKLMGSKMFGLLRMIRIF